VAGRKKHSQHARIIIAEVSLFAFRIVHHQELSKMSADSFQAVCGVNENTPVFSPAFGQEPVREKCSWFQVNKIRRHFSNIRFQLSPVKTDKFRPGLCVELIEQIWDGGAVENGESIHRPLILVGEKMGDKRGL